MSDKCTLRCMATKSPADIHVQRGVRGKWKYEEPLGEYTVQVLYRFPEDSSRSGIEPIEKVRMHLNSAMSS